MKLVFTKVYMSECDCRMMESGLLSFDEAKNVFEKKQMRKFSSPTKAVKRSTESVTVKKKPESSLKKTTDSRAGVKQSKKRKVNDGSSEDDFSIQKMATKQKAK